MKLRHLRYFVTVAEELHFGRAAAKLHMAQPPLSHQIRQLEAEVGAELLHRTTRVVELTPAGVVFLERAREILAAVDSAIGDTIRAERGEVGRLSIGFVGSATYEVLPAVASSIRAELPGIELDLHGELLTPAQVEGLQSRRLDLAFLRPPVRASDLAVEVIRREPLVVVLPADHPLASESSVRVSDLAEEPFVTYPSQFRSVMQESIDALCRAARFMPKVVQEVNETATLVSFVAARVGVALVPASVQHLQVTGCVYRPLADRHEQVALAIAWRRDDPYPVLARVRQLVSRDVNLKGVRMKHCATQQGKNQKTSLRSLRH
ncbi:MAG: LysR family transcriptional regulator [Bacteroidota bacterium]